MQSTLSPSVSLHSPDNEDCPFCPGKEESAKWKTYPGEKNDSKTLRHKMRYPKKLHEGGKMAQANARPVYAEKNWFGDGNVATYPDSKSEPGHIFEHPDVNIGPYGNQAHHALSGNQILKGHPIEDYIVKGKVIKADTGYCVNNWPNGVCLPAYPKIYNKKSAIEKWSDLSSKKQTLLSNSVMMATSMLQV